MTFGDAMFVPNFVKICSMGQKLKGQTYTGSMTT